MSLARGATKTAFATALVLALLTGRARAQGTSQAFAAANATVGYNIISTPFGFPTSTSAQGPFATLGASLGDSVTTQRTHHTLTYHFSAFLPINQSFQFTQNPIRYSNSLAYVGGYELTPTVNMFAGLKATLTPLNTFNPNLGPASSQILATPPGYTEIFNPSARVGFTKHISPKLSATVAEVFNSSIPINALLVTPRVYDATTSLTVNRNFSRDLIKTALTSTAGYIGVQETPTGVVDPRTLVITSLTSTWVHTLSPEWSTRAQAGVTNVVSQTTQGSVFWQPAVGGIIDYKPQIGRVVLGYHHSTGINSLTAQVNIVNQVSLRGAVPLGKTNEFFGFVGASYGHTSSILPSGGLISPIDLLLADGGVTYRPARLPKFSFAGRYTWLNQTPTQNPGGAFTQQTVTFTITYAYPNALLLLKDTEVPDDLDETGLSSDLTGEVPPGTEPPAEEEEAPPEKGSETAPQEPGGNAPPPK